MAAAAKVKPPALSSRHASCTSKGQHDTEFLSLLKIDFSFLLLPWISPCKYRSCCLETPAPEAHRLDKVRPVDPKHWMQQDYIYDNVSSHVPAASF